jgi:hypothetical protein
MPSVIRLLCRSTWNQRGNCGPILDTVHSYRILQLSHFVFCSCTRTRTSIRLVDAGIQGIMPSAITLCLRSTKNQRGNCTPILSIVSLYCILQPVFFFCCSDSLASSHSADVGIHVIVPSVTTLFMRSTRNQSGNRDPILSTVRLY